MSETVSVADRRPSAAIEALIAPVRRVCVWPGAEHVITRAEEALVATPTFQRLWRLRQMGFAFHAFPSAENCRASHSLGVAYWASRFLAHLDASPVDRDGLSTGLVVKLFALLHDIDLLPLGHTLRYQSNLLVEVEGGSRVARCVATILDHVGRSAFLDAEAPARRAMIEAFRRHLDAAALAFSTSNQPSAALAAEVVNSMVGADLFDFALRDSHAIGRAQPLYADYPGGLRLIEHGERRRLALDGAHAWQIDDLYRARFEIFAASVYHPRKLAADAMLDAIVRRIESGPADPRWQGEHLLDLGDDQLLGLAVELEDRLDDGIRLVPQLTAGQLYDEVFRLTDLEAFEARADAARALSLEPQWRTKAEAALLARVPSARRGDLIVALSSPRMQAKPPDVLLVDDSGTVTGLSDAPGVRAAETAAAYCGLWSLRVYLAPERRSLRAEVAQSAAEAFGSRAPTW